jgi:metal-responsive CopG/Arc/MetJ family transcriptional regulator
MSKKRPAKSMTTKGGLVREVAYLYEDEAKLLDKAAERERCSKSEIIRRALRAYLQDRSG